MNGGLLHSFLNLVVVNVPEPAHRKPAQLAVFRTVRGSVMPRKSLSPRYFANLRAGALLLLHMKSSTKRF